MIHRLTSDDTAHMVLLKEEALGAEDCSANEESLPINEGDPEQQSSTSIPYHRGYDVCLGGHVSN